MKKRHFENGGKEKNATSPFFFFHIGLNLLKKYLITRVLMLKCYLEMVSIQTTVKFYGLERAKPLIKKRYNGRKN